MKCLRAVLVGLVVIACFFLAGFKKPMHKNPNKKQALVGVQKSQQKPLDLTVPIREVSFDAPLETTIAVVQNTLPVAFDANNRDKTRPVELQGKVIMTQEQEAGKARSADGAGIEINLHH